MAVFSINKGAVALTTWDVDSGQATFHETATRVEDALVVLETEKVEFVLDPAQEGIDFRISIGDVPVSEITPQEDAGGVQWGGRIFWRRANYFESARGLTPVILQSQCQDAEKEHWETALAFHVCVLPSKVSEDHYNQMTTDLQQLSHSLVLDLYGKSRSTHDIRYAKGFKTFHSGEQELTAIESALETLATVLTSIMSRPAFRINTVCEWRNYWGSERLVPQEIKRLGQKVVAPGKHGLPLRVQSLRRVESFDIPEHRITQAFLQLLVRRAKHCAWLAHEHVRAINSEKHLRHIRLKSGPTLYESVDVPRIRRLRIARLRAERCVVLGESLSRLPFLHGIMPQFADICGGVFRRNADYGLLLRIIRKFLVENAIWYEGEFAAQVTKLTSRLFEQWCFLRLIDAFRTCGLALADWNESLRQNLRSRFLLDLERGLTFEGTLSNSLMLRFRYEPWILGLEAARIQNETLCRVDKKNVAWCPDILIECLRRGETEWLPIYAIVLDSKYVTNPKDSWNAVTKYLEIRDTQRQR